MDRTKILSATLLVLTSACELPEEPEELRSGGPYICPNCPTTEDFGVEMLGLHNDLRASLLNGSVAINGRLQPRAAYLPKLVWDTQLEQGARAWVDEMPPTDPYAPMEDGEAFGHSPICGTTEAETDNYDYCRDAGVLENITFKNHTDLEGLFDLWNNEAGFYDFADDEHVNPDANPAGTVGHYKVLASERVYAIGCAINYYGSNDFYSSYKEVVCQYRYLDDYPSNVQPYKDASQFRPIYSMRHAGVLDYMFSTLKSEGGYTASSGSASFCYGQPCFYLAKTAQANTTLLRRNIHDGRSNHPWFYDHAFGLSGAPLTNGFKNNVVYAQEGGLGYIHDLPGSGLPGTRVRLDRCWAGSLHTTHGFIEKQYGSVCATWQQHDSGPVGYVYPAFFAPGVAQFP